MRVLIACEFSGTVRDAFIKVGHDAWSCDLLPTKTPGPHIQGNVLDVLDQDWDLMIAHPPCTYLARSGARWWSARLQQQQQGIDFFLTLINTAIPKVAVENPIGKMSTVFRKPDQIIQPWQFGHGETKATCLWLKNLPELFPTCIVSGRNPRIYYLPPSSVRWMERSLTYAGIATAMAEQWG